MDLCNPAMRWKKPNTELLQSPSMDNGHGQNAQCTMDICTPAVTKIPRDIFCTPSMEMCTPLVSYNKHTLDMRTPALSSVPSSMELCTPASNNVISSMDMCTPQVIEDSLEVKTPEIGDLSLESPNKKKKMSHNDEEDLKNSGISSPELSRRECRLHTFELSRRETQEDSQKLHWFIIEDPIRGFKYKPY